MGPVLATLILLLCLAAARAQDVTPPECVGVTPASATLNVPVNTPVVFTFSEPMNPNPTLISVSFQRFVPPFTLEEITNFAAAWSPDQLKLTCTFSPSLPPSSFITWTLGDTFEDLAGNPIDLSVNGDGAFQTGTGSGGTGSGTNAVTSCFVLRQVDYEQTTSGAPTLSLKDPFGFSAGTVLASNRTASVISLTIPSPGTRTVQLSPNPFAAEAWFFVEATNSQNGFDANYPIAGAYSFSIQSPASNQTVNVQFPPGPQPPPLHVSNFTASQAIATNQSFTLTWDAAPGGTTTDFILVDIEQVGLSSPDFGEVGALTGQSTSFVIPAGRLAENSNYDATIAFYKFNTSSNFTTRLATTGALVTRTSINLKTTGGGVQPVAPTLANLQLTGGQIQFQVTATPGQLVIIDRAASPVAGAWQPFQTNTLTSTPWVVTEPLAAGESRFYRARTP